MLLWLASTLKTEVNRALPSHSITSLYFRPLKKEFWIGEVLHVSQYPLCAFLESAPLETPGGALVHGSLLIRALGCSKPPEDMLQDPIL